jgi:hypothetical protein
VEMQQHRDHGHQRQLLGELDREGHVLEITVAVSTETLIYS